MHLSLRDIFPYCLPLKEEPGENPIIEGGADYTSLVLMTTARKEDQRQVFFTVVRKQIQGLKRWLTS